MQNIRDRAMVVYNFLAGLLCPVNEFITGNLKSGKPWVVLVTLIGLLAGWFTSIAIMLKISLWGGWRLFEITAVIVVGIIAGISLYHAWIFFSKNIVNSMKD